MSMRDQADLRALMKRVEELEARLAEMEAARKPGRPRKNADG